MRVATTIALCSLALGCTQRTSIGVPANLTEEQVIVPMNTSAKLDLLFMVDNSPSMLAMQTQLLAHVGDLVTSLSGATSGHPVDLHIGVVTSDYGAGTQSTRSGGGGCDASPGGQHGHLQAIGAAAASGCVAPTGARYITYQVAADGTITSNLPGGNTPSSLVQTFTCMASVGAIGCGFEHQLESVYAALHDTDTNAGFLRDDAALSIVLLTNEDDGSAPPTSTFYNPDPSLDEIDGAYSTYRQTHFGVTCDGAPTPEGPSNGPLSNCVPTPNPDADPSSEYDVSRYISYLTQPKSAGGLKDNPWSVSIITIAPPVSPFETLYAVPNTGNGLAPNPSYVSSSCNPMSTMCTVVLQHSCQNQIDEAFFGDPPIRLDAVRRAAPLNRTISICGDDLNAEPDYTSGMTEMGSVMGSQALGGCLYLPAVLSSNPICTVTTSSNADVKHCDDKSSTSCWDLVTDLGCPQLTDPSTDKIVQERLVLRGIDSDVLASCHVYSP